VSSRIGEIFDGVVMGVTDFGLFVELTGHYVQGLLHVSELGEEYFQFQPVAMALVGEGSGRKFALGDSLSVQLADVEPALGRLDLALTPKPGTGMPMAEKGSSERSASDRSRRGGGGNSGNSGNSGGGRGRSDKPRKRRRGGKGKGQGQGQGQSQSQGQSQGQKPNQNQGPNQDQK
jgi:ribonuclease R